ncbi:MAG: DUF1080 domain-containing protein [Acidobacteriota bacterium]
MASRLLSVALLLAPALGADGWRPLLNGQDLSGFERVGTARWTIHGGVLVGCSTPEKPGVGWLMTQQEYSDFRLRLKFWISPGGNSGIAIRDPSHARGVRSPAHNGYEIQIYDGPDADYPTGSIYLLARAPQRKLKSGEWNQLLIACKGTHIEVELNGENVSEADHVRSRRGAIGFQLHSRNMTVRFKDIEIEE